MKGTQQGFSTLLDIAVMAVIVELILIVILLASVPPADAATQLFTDDFETGDFSKWYACGPRNEISTSQVHSGTYSLHYANVIQSGECAVFFSPSREIYYTYYWYFPTGINFNFAPGKHFWRFGCGDESNYGSCGSIDTGPDPDFLPIGSMDIVYFLGPEVVFWNANTLPIGRWFKYEFYTRLNDPGVANGEAKVWIDGVLYLNETSVNLNATSNDLNILRFTTNYDNCTGVCDWHMDDVEVWDGCPPGSPCSGTPPPSTNLLFDDFEDSVMNWDVDKGDWTESGGALTGVGDSKATAFAPVAWSPSGVSSCSTCTIKVDDIVTQGGENNKIKIIGWYTDSDNKAEVIFKEEKDKVTLKQFVDGATTKETANDVLMEPNIPFDAEVSFDGSNIEVIVNGVSALTVPAEGVLAGKVGFQVKNTTGSFGQITVE